MNRVRLYKARQGEEGTDGQEAQYWYREGHDSMPIRKIVDTDTDTDERYRAGSRDLESQSRQRLYRSEWGRTG
jgi:hypothetical protein